jgi:hypothetical protein
MNTPAQSPAKELVISPCREWSGAPTGPIVEAGQSLSYGTGGYGAGEDAWGAISGVQALTWADAIYPSAPNYDYDPAPPCPLVYGVDTYGATPSGGYNYWPGGAAGGGTASAPSGESVMWLSDAARCVGSYPNTPGDTINARQYFFRLCQASWWVYLPGWLSRIPDFEGYVGGYESMTYAYRGRYKLDRYRAGFRANCELWAVNSSGAFGWDDYADGVAMGTADAYIGILPRNVVYDAPIGAAPGIWREVLIPAETSGSGSTEDGFLGLATFEVWGIGFDQWRAATGL